MPEAPKMRETPSLLALALRVLRGELSEAEAIEIVRHAGRRSADNSERSDR